MKKPFSMTDGPEARIGTSSEATTMVPSSALPFRNSGLPSFASTNNVDQKPALKQETRQSEDKKDVKMELSRYESLRFGTPGATSNDCSETQPKSL